MTARFTGCDVVSEAVIDSAADSALSDSRVCNNAQRATVELVRWRVGYDEADSALQLSCVVRLHSNPVSKTDTVLFHHI